MAKKKQLVKAGIYNAMIDKVIGHKDGSVTVQMSLFAQGFTFVERLRTTPEKETNPEEGHTRFFIANRKLGIYTSIGADNIHHASNKATKLFGQHWDFMRHEHNCSELRGYEHMCVAKFNELLRTL